MTKTYLVGVAAVALAVLAGCGPKDGTKELAEGKAAYDVRDLKKAERLFTRSAMLAPANVDALVCLVRVKLDLGDLPAAAELIERAAALAGEDSDVRLLGAQIAWHQKDYDMARKRFRALADDEALSATIRSLGWAGVGIVEMTENNRDLARIALLRAIRVDRYNASARYHLGMLYRDAFNYNEAALEQFDVFVRLQTDADARVRRVQQTVIPDLKDTITRAAADRPGVANRNSTASAAAIEKAKTEIRKGNFKSARQAYQDALKADPLSYPAALGLAEMYLKTDTSSSGRQSALANYQLACTLRYGAVGTFVAAGNLAYQLGQYMRASEIYSRAIAANPNSIDAIDGLIRSLQKIGGEKAKLAQAYQRYRDFLKPSKGR